jgi:ParB family chromosome partitioning protein
LLLNKNDKGYITKHSYHKENEYAFYPLHWKGYCTTILDTEFIIVNNFKMAIQKTKITAEFKNISLKDIEVDINQPRKFFDEQSLVELATSVKANGVLQPIMVRPNGKKYLLIYGERRYKAATAVGLKEIPAIIRELTDAEALDIQITENLQRKDVHPMEEAVGFKRLLDTLSIEDIGLRIGKSESFVAKRIQLTELVEEAQQVFFHNKITISQALKLARVDMLSQKEILNDLLDEDWLEDSEFEIESYRLNRYIDRITCDLSNPIFSLSDKSLYKEAGACKNCKFNSATTPLLFDNGEKEHICSKPSCFEIKTQRQYKKNLEELVSDPSKIFIVSCSKNFLSDDSKNKIKIAEELGVKIFYTDSFKKLDTPGKLMSFDEWKLDSFNEDEDDEVMLKNEYEEYQRDMQNEIDEYNSILSSGKSVITYDILTSEKVVVVFNEKANEEIEQSTGNAGSNEIKEEIAKIESKEARAKELDAEKVWEKIRELLHSDVNKNKIYNSNTLNKIEIQALGAALYASLGYHTRKLAEKLIGMDSYKQSSTSFQYSIPAINMLERIFIMEKLVNAFGSHVSSGQNKLAYDVINQYLSKEILEIELDQKGIAEVRGERVSKRIAALKEKLIMN